MKKAFTLVELLIVMAILGVLVALAAGNFRTAQMKGRDAQRKSDLKQIANSLELYYQDYGKYPDTGSISWGSQFSDAKGTVYFKTLPIDPSSDLDYVYRLVDSPANQKYQLFAHLENTQDQDIIDDAIGVGCGGSGGCNFAVTSANTNATE